MHTCHIKRNAGEEGSIPWHTRPKYPWWSTIHINILMAKVTLSAGNVKTV